MRNGIVIRPYNMVYWFTPKAACTSFKRHFADLMQLSYDRSNNTTVHACNFELIGPELIYQYTSFLHLCITRDPFTRLLSLWKEKILTTQVVDRAYQRGAERAVFGKYGTVFRGGMSFHEFIRAVVRIPHQYADVHFAPQALLLPNPLPDYQLKLETLQEDLALFQLATGIRLNVEMHNATAPLDIQPVTTQEERQMVYDYYQLDYALFGYKVHDR